MKPKHNENEVEMRITNLFQNAVENEKTSVKYSDVSSEVYTSPLSQKKRITFLIFICIVLVFPTAGYAISKVSISELFNEIKQKLVQHEGINNNIVAKVNGQSILVKDFVFYKANLEFIWKMNNVKVNKTNMDLLTDMIKERLVVQFADERGYSVSNDEVESYIGGLKTHLNQPDFPKDIKEIMQNRIKLSGLTEEEFWKSPDIVKGYRDLLLKDKVGQKLNLQVADYEKFKEDLWIQKKDSIQIFEKSLTN